MVHQLKDTKFKIIVGKASDFTSIGMGASDNISFEDIIDDMLGEIRQITIEGGGYIICDNCNNEVEDNETCYYIPVLNRIFCERCFNKWHENATHYDDDTFYEEVHYEDVKGGLEERGLWN